MQNDESARLYVTIGLEIAEYFNQSSRIELLKYCLVTQMVKNLPVMQETWVWFLGREDLWRREWLPTPVFLPGEFHEQRSLVGYSPWSHKELDTTEQLTHTHTIVSVSKQY